MRPAWRGCASPAPSPLGYRGPVYRHSAGTPDRRTFMWTVPKGYQEYDHDRALTIRAGGPGRAHTQRSAAMVNGCCDEPMILDSPASSASTDHEYFPPATKRARTSAGTGRRSPLDTAV